MKTAKSTTTILLHAWGFQRVYKTPTTVEERQKLADLNMERERNGKTKQDREPVRQLLNSVSVGTGENGKCVDLEECKKVLHTPNGQLSFRMAELEPYVESGIARDEEDVVKRWALARGLNVKVQTSKNGRFVVAWTPKVDETPGY